MFFEIDKVCSKIKSIQQNITWKLLIAAIFSPVSQVPDYIWLAMFSAKAHFETELSHK